MSRFCLALTKSSTVDPNKMNMDPNHSSKDLFPEDFWVEDSQLSQPTSTHQNEEKSPSPPQLTQRSNSPNDRDQSPSIPFDPIFSRARQLAKPYGGDDRKYVTIDFVDRKEAGRRIECLFAIYALQMTLHSEDERNDPPCLWTVPRLRHNCLIDHKGRVRISNKHWVKKPFNALSMGCPIQKLKKNPSHKLYYPQKNKKQREWRIPCSLLGSRRAYLFLEYHGRAKRIASGNILFGALDI